MTCTAKIRANDHTARISCVSVWASSIVLSSCCTEESSWRMLSLIGIYQRFLRIGQHPVVNQFLWCLVLFHREKYSIQKSGETTLSIEFSHSICNSKIAKYFTRKSTRTQFSHLLWVYIQKLINKGEEAIGMAWPLV